MDTFEKIVLKLIGCKLRFQIENSIQTKIWLVRLNICVESYRWCLAVWRMYSKAIFGFGRRSHGNSGSFVLETNSKVLRRRSWPADSNQRFVQLQWRGATTKWLKEAIARGPYGNLSILATNARRSAWTSISRCYRNWWRWWVSWAQANVCQRKP